jgi:hypothetical protein
VHEGGFEVRGRAPDGLTFFSPAGVEVKALPPSPPPLPADPAGALRALHAAEGLEIRPESNVISWQGERWDLGWAVEALQSMQPQHAMSDGGAGG